MVLVCFWKIPGSAGKLEMLNNRDNTYISDSRTILAEEQAKMRSQEMEANLAATLQKIKNI